MSPTVTKIKQKRLKRGENSSGLPLANNGCPHFFCYPSARITRLLSAAPPAAASAVVVIVVSVFLSLSGIHLEN